MKSSVLILTLILASSSFVLSKEPLKKDVFETSAGKFSLTFLGHASLLIEFNNKTIYIDPCKAQADFSQLPKADLILITHEHQDHLDQKAIDEISGVSTQIICNPAVFAILNKGIALKNGERKTWDKIEIEAVPAYNTTEGRDKYHPKGRDNGYILTIGDKKIYIAGDTENIPGMDGFKNITIAILPMNQPYTMTPEQVLRCSSVLKPLVLYPYHTTAEDIQKLKVLMSSPQKTELRIRTSN